MTSTFLLTSIALVTALMGSAALARTDQAPAAELHVARDGCRVDMQHARTNHDHARNDRDERCLQRERQASGRHRVQASPVLQVVPNRSLPDQEAYGWKYYSDPRAAHAVIISPVGEYFLSQGDGPRQITGPTGDVWVPQPIQQ